MQSNPSPVVGELVADRKVELEVYSMVYRVFERAGHNLPQERPAEWVEAVLDARAMTAVA
jgi:hypothetical protein